MKRTMGAGLFVSVTLALLISLSSLSVQASQPEFSFVDINGEAVDFKAYRGKWVVVNYWATWCPPCLEEIPELVHFHEEHKDNKAVVVGFNMEEMPPEL
ncbi:MAG TPA: TlpA disulfide reductase family protein, partial [Gammaproteobacteria bacterium]